jgi:hypothetical protein
MKNTSVFIRLIRTFILWLALGVASAFATGVTVVPIATGWREAGSFKRISEYFSGRENTGGQLILRTQPDQRSGYYFQMRVATVTTIDARLVLQVITPDSAAPRTYKFTATLTGPKTMLNLGLTGADWTDLKINPVAWKLEVLSADGKLLATETSYLWGKQVGQ